MRDKREKQGGSVPAIEALGVGKTFRQGTREIHVLIDMDFRVEPGEFVAVVGPSGAGKSTLLHILGSLEKPSVGTVAIQGHDVAALGDEKRARLRRSSVGFVFQFHHLLPAFTALENVAMPARILGVPPGEAEKRARELLEMVGVSHRLDNKPSELSGGEQQRVAVARALVNRPAVVLADEPTGNLDRTTGVKLEDDLITFSRSEGAAVVVVTHNEEWAARADRVVRIVDGRVATSPV